MLSTLNTPISTLTTMIGTSVMDLERRMVVHAARCSQRQFDKIVFLDADTLVFDSLDGLFGPAACD